MENMFMSAGGGSAFGGKKITSSLIFGLSTAIFFGLAFTALANSPYLSISGSGSNLTLNISGAPSNSQIQLSYTVPGSSLPTTVSNFGTTDYNGNFSTNVSSSAYGLNSGSQVYVTVGGQQSNIVNYGYGYGGSCTYNCGSPYALSLSQNNLNLNIGQSQTVTIYNNNNNYYNNYNNNFYISSNSNSSVASASINGSSVYVYANQSGNTTISICQSGGTSGCASLYVTVSGSVLGASNYNVYIYDNYYSPQNITIPQGSSVTFRNSGSMSHTVTFDSSLYTDSGTLYPGGTFTQTFNTVGTFYFHCRFHSGMTAAVTVTQSGNGSGGGNNGYVWFNPNNPSLYAGQSLAVSINSSVGNYSYSSGYSNYYYVSANTNSNVVSASVSGSVVNLYANQSGSATVTVCHSALNFCGSLYVTVTGGGYGGGYYGSNLTLSQTSLNLTLGQSGSVIISSNNNYNNFYNNFTISSNSSPTVADATISGNSLNVFARNAGATTFSICQNNSSYGCANLYVTVSGYYYGGNYNYGGGNYGGYYYNGGALQYPAGSVAGASVYPNGELINDNGTVYIVYKNTKTGFALASVFTGLGFNFSNVAYVSNSGLVDSGYIVRTSAASHPWGSWIRSGQTIYFVSDLGLIPVPNLNTLYSNGGQENLIVNANIYDFRLPILPAMTVGDYRLQ